MVRYAPEGFAAGIGSLLQPLFAVQPSRSWQSASTLSCTRSKGGGRRGADTGQLDESGAAVRLSDYSVGVLCVPLSSTFSPRSFGKVTSPRSKPFGHFGDRRPFSTGMASLPAFVELQNRCRQLLRRHGVLEQRSLLCPTHYLMTTRSSARNIRPSTTFGNMPTRPGWLT
jgi:hypothetical protein